MKIIHTSFSRVVWDLYTDRISYDDLVLVYANTAHLVQDVLTNEAFEKMSSLYNQWSVADTSKIKAIITRLVHDNKLHQCRLFPHKSPHFIFEAEPYRFSILEEHVPNQCKVLYDRYITVSKLSTDDSYSAVKDIKLAGIDFNQSMLEFCSDEGYNPEFVIAPEGFKWHPNIWDYNNNVCQALIEQFPYKDRVSQGVLQQTVYGLFNDGRIVFRNPTLDEFASNCPYPFLSLKIAQLSELEASSWERFRIAANIP